MIGRWTGYFTVCAVVANGLDMLSTVHVSPDLSGEANPVAAFIGMSWSTLWAIKIVCVVVAVPCFYFGLRTIMSRVDRLAGKDGCVELLSYLVYKSPFRS